MQYLTERRLVIWGLILLGLCFSIVALFTEIPAGGADNYAHYNISRWAFRYPHLFLDHWGKPVFTLITAPFAQLGLTAVRIFNVIAGLLTAWFSYRLTLHFKLRAAWFAAVIAIFTPIYFVMMFSAMTEILFSLFLIISIYLFFREKYFRSAIIISFLFLIRSEGLAFLGLFLIAFLVKKQYRYIPFLLTGFLLSSLVGWVFYYGDFWWLINKRPYAIGGTDIYGSGEWYAFFKTMPLYFGPVVPVFLLAGTLVILMKWIKIKSVLASDSILPVILILGSFWGYLLVHNFLWWQGISSAGLVRVMAAVSPLVGVIAAFALDLFVVKWKKVKVINGILIGLGIYMVVAAGDYFKRSVSRDPTIKVLNEASDFLKKPEYANHKLVVNNPYFAYATGRDAWNPDVVQYGFANKINPGADLPDSALFVWDAHFSPNEGSLPLNTIMENKDFVLIEFFEPATPYIVLGGNNYQILIFRKISGAGNENDKIFRKLREQKISKNIYFSDELSFEEKFPDAGLETRRITRTDTESDFAYSMEDIEFSPAFHIPAEQIKSNQENKIRATVEVFLLQKLNSNEVLMIFSVEETNQVHHYVADDFAKQNLQYNVWDKADFIFNIPQEMNEKSVMKVYIWNIGRNNLLIDNFKVDIFRQSN